MHGDESCLVRKISHYTALSDTEKHLLNELERESRTVRRHETLVDEGETNRLFVLDSGWVYTFIHTPDGRRQILDLHFPGDVVGTNQIAFAESTCGIAAATDAVICPFPKSGLRSVFSNSPKLTALFYTFAMIDHAAVLDRLRATGRMPAASRVLLVLLQCRARLRIMDPAYSDEFELPLHQEVIGDLVGLSNISVSNALKQLKEEGLIARQGRWISFPNEERATQLIDFADHYYEIDTSWFPGL
ncbi:Crp/Fnr family transcriptional regulator [Afifella marina]|uniref:cAMP-binding domain of CRP or a regulatory subunit of cAMP-dependent protein kinases n=1 Tax=Afifella marina DSM 2698 TaxID=1120955 RepID=A0A1G5P5Q5_AFIMA|nr:Crp/Fnr family transcriptional regulator [Afifella marina]SCZ44854.1 cAMP-binding domain of CRP or a regulatory subunit of cAMP-dependent protein kinases [Afifella marina DSM 2698]